jgi:hypothetical protein
MLDKVKDSATPQQRRQKEIEATRKLLAEAPQLLKEVDESEILRNASKRLYPTFDRSEIRFGPLLGVGGFGIVFEVKEINLKIPIEVDVLETKPPPATTSSTDAATSTTTASASIESNAGNALYEGSGLTSQIPQNSEESQSTAITTIALTDDLNHVAIKLHSGVTAQDDAHYDVRIARKHMAQMVRRNGDARYAVKRLHRDLTDLERARGMIDLAIEAKYLSVMWHPNIGACLYRPLRQAYCIVYMHLHATLFSNETVLFRSSFCSKNAWHVNRRFYEPQLFYCYGSFI